MQNTDNDKMPINGKDNNDTRKSTAWIDRIKKMLGAVSLTKLNFLLWGLAVVVVSVVCLKLCHTAESTTLSVEVEQKIDVTPTIITSMKEIGEWEFLSITDEEMVDTMKKGFLRTDKLVRIYYGELRLGLNLHKAGPKWVTQIGDSVAVMLPPIELLDNNFIDETRTRAFISTGKWTDTDRDALYDRAYHKMIARCFTKENKQKAADNAKVQFSNMLRSLGIKKFSVSFRNEE